MWTPQQSCDDEREALRLEEETNEKIAPCQCYSLRVVGGTGSDDDAPASGSTLLLASGCDKRSEFG